MTARRDAMEAARERVLLAIRDLVIEELDFEPTLERIAARADVSVQTVLRRFGSRDAAFAAAVAAATADIVAERRPPERDVDVALTTLLDHYELRGEFVLAMVARERTSPTVMVLADTGRREHRRWIEQVFGHRLPTDGADRESLVDQLVVVTDVSAWKLLRRDRGHAPAVVHARMRAMTDALLDASGDR